MDALKKNKRGGARKGAGRKPKLDKLFYKNCTILVHINDYKEFKIKAKELNKEIQKKRELEST